MLYVIQFGSSTNFYYSRHHVDQMSRALELNSTPHSIQVHRRIVTLADGYNGHTCQFYAEPVETEGCFCRLRCAEPGKEYMTRWARLIDSECSICRRPVYDRPHEHPCE